MKGYIAYLLDKKLSKGFRTLLTFILPILISLSALYIAYSSYRVSNGVAKRNKTAGWTHEIKLVDSAFMLQSITFKSTKNDIVLQNVEVFLPAPLEKFSSSKQIKDTWYCTNAQMNIAEVLSGVFECRINSYSPTSEVMPLLNLPVVFKFTYIDNGRLQNAYSFYDIRFRYFPQGKIKFYTLNFISHLNTKSEAEVNFLLDYKNKSEGFYKYVFSRSAELDSTIAISVYANLYDYLQSLRGEAYGSFVEAVEAGGLSIDIKNEPATSVILNSYIYCPSSIVDSISLTKNVIFIDSIVNIIGDQPKCQKLKERIGELKKWINKDAFCFYFTSQDEYNSCVVNTPWSYEFNYNDWISLLDDIKIEIFKVVKDDPLFLLTD